MKHVSKAFCILFWVILCMGCTTNLDRHLLKINNDIRDANLRFISVCRAYADIADAFVVNKHLLEEGHLQRSWDAFYKEHTLNGVLVEDPLNPALGSMKPETLKEALIAADKSRQRYEESKRQWEMVHQAFLAALDELEEACKSTKMTEDTLIEAQKNVEQYMQSVLNTFTRLSTLIAMP